VHAFQRRLEVPAGGLAVGTELEVLADGELWPQLPALGHQGDAELGPAVRRHPQQRAALEDDVPARHRTQPGDGTQRGRLAGAVGADEGHHLPLAYLEAEAEQGLRIAVEAAVHEPFRLSDFVADPADDPPCIGSSTSR
jgi:hypothetical protein